MLCAMSKGIHAVLVNVGSPASPAKRGVARFLRRFLMDRYVIALPWLFRYFLVRFIIIPLRVGRVAARYRRIWGDVDSPIIEYTSHLTTKVITALAAKSSDATASSVMRHGERTIKEEFRQLKRLGVEELLIIPMFPQFERSTHLSIVEAAQKAANKCRMKMRYNAPFFEDEGYISSLEGSIRGVLATKEVDKLIYSFHSVPLKNLPCAYKEAAQCELQGEAKSEICEGCYKRQCYVTAHLTSEGLGIERDRYMVAFQSTMRFRRWLSPTLSAILSELPSQGVEHVAVVTPSFMVECLETLDEVKQRGRDLFISKGGREFTYIPAINDQDMWAKRLAEWIVEADDQLE